MEPQSPSQRLHQLGLQLPEVARPVAAYVPWVRDGDIVFISGQIPILDGKVMYSGRVGAECSLEQAQTAARLCALNGLAAGAQAAGGLDRIRRVLKVIVYVASTPDFTEQHKAANGASELLAQVFGDAGRHARAAVGVASLPLNATVEVDITFAVDGPSTS